MPQRTTVRLKDIDEAAYLWLPEQGMEFRQADLESLGYRSQVWFIFESDKTEEEVNTVRNAYRNGQSRVEPKAFASKQFELKKIVREKVDGKGGRR